MNVWGILKQYTWVVIRLGKDKAMRCMIYSLMAALIVVPASAFPQSSTDNPPPRERRIAEEIELYRNLKEGVVTVEADGGHGSGFIVDSRGLILTNQHVVRDAVNVRVQFDDMTKVEAKILVVDRRADIAVLWVNLAAYPGFKVLPIAKLQGGQPTVVEGEKVLAIGSPLSHRKILTVGIVSKVEEKVIISDVNINPGNSGGPLFNSVGEVVGITTFGERRAAGPGISGIVRIEQALPLLMDAGRRLDSKPPSAALLPVEPKTKFPLEGLEKAVSDENYEVNHYEFDTKQYEVTLQTPVLRLYMTAGTRIEAARRKFQERKKQLNAKAVSMDPLEDLKDYGSTSEYDAVVEIIAMPKVKETGKSIFFRSLMAGLGAMGGQAIYTPGRYVWDADFYQMRLLCDGSEVVPIKAGRVEQVGTLPSYYGRDAHYTYFGYYRYTPNVFDPSKCRQLSLQIFSEEDSSKPDTKVIEKKVVDRVWADFREYFTVQKSP